MNLLLIKGFVLKFGSHDLSELQPYIRVDPKATGEDNRLATEIAVESNSMDVVDLLWGALQEEVPEKVRVQQLSRAMFKKDLEEGKRKFTELLSSLSAELVRFCYDEQLFIFIIFPGDLYSYKWFSDSSHRSRPRRQDRLCPSSVGPWVGYCFRTLRLSETW